MIPRSKGHKISHRYLKNYKLLIHYVGIIIMNNYCTIIYFYLIISKFASHISNKWFIWFLLIFFLFVYYNFFYIRLIKCIYNVHKIRFKQCISLFTNHNTTIVLFALNIIFFKTQINVWKFFGFVQDNNNK